MNTRNFNKWIKALRSGEFEQTTGQLIANMEDESGNELDEFGFPVGEYDTTTPRSVGFCCLGVAAQVLSPDDDGWVELSLAPREVIDALGLPIKRADYAPDESTEFDIGIEGGKTAAGLNDEGLSFKFIANWLEKNKDRLVATF